MIADPIPGVVCSAVSASVALRSGNGLGDRLILFLLHYPQLVTGYSVSLNLTAESNDIIRCSFQL